MSIDKSHIASHKTIRPFDHGPLAIFPGNFSVDSNAYDIRQVSDEELHHNKEGGSKWHEVNDDTPYSIRGPTSGLGHGNK
jgi:hypothetical protein